MKYIKNTEELKQIFLNEDEVHIWHSDLDKLRKDNNFLLTLLSQDERNKADRFHFEKDSERFIAGRGLLRLLLGFYTGNKENMIQLDYTEFGKPFISKNKNKNLIHFNISHSENSISFSFTNIADIGIDIEFLRPIQNFLELAERNFSAAEYKQLLDLSEQKMLEGFYNCWTRKEATIKAVGEGLSFPLRDFDVSLKPGEETKILLVSGRAAIFNEKIDLYSFNAEENQVGALAVLGNVRRIKHFKIDNCSLFN